MITRTKHFTPRIIIAAMFCLLSTGCAPKAPLPVSGFLDDYSKLRPSDALNGSLVWENQAKQMSIYKMITMDPVQVFIPPELDNGTYTAQIQQLARAFEEEMQAVSGDSYPLVDHSGFGVLRARIAITNVKPEKTVMGVGSAKSLFGLDLHHAFLEVQLLDTQNGDRVMELVNLHQPGSYRKPVGTKLYRDSRDILRSWAVLIRDALDQTRGLHGTDSFHSSFGMY